MRDIKFRLWCENRNEWEQEAWCINPEGVVLCFFQGGMIPVKDETHIIEQFTGLIDKNGVDIYEGDIISYWPGTIKPDKNGTQEYEGIKYSHDDNVNKVIVFSDQSFRILNGNVLGAAYHQSDKILVVGNIHENSDLLTT